VHHIQRKILGKLLYAESLTYSEMRPAGVESNHFAYHLDQLVHAGIVGKHNKQYALTPQGLALVDRMSQAKVVDRLQPHILTIIDVTNDQGQTLLYERKFQPYIHKLGFPLGKTHLEETIMAAAERELYEKTGLTGIPLVQRGIVYVHITQQGQTITKALGHVFSGQVADAPATVTDEQRGSCVWADDTQFPPADMMPGFLEIKALLQKATNELFFAELSLTIQ